MARRLLIVDDEETIRWALKELFMQEGWEVRCAESGDAAVAMLEQEDFHYMITDLKMAGRSGIELVQAARQHNPGMGVTILTGFATTDTAGEAVRLGVWDYRTKPCDIASLKQRVEQYFENEPEATSASSPARAPLDSEDLASFLEGAGTDLLRAQSVRPGEEAELWLNLLGTALLDLGFPRDRTFQITQPLVEALARVPAGGGRCRAALLKGHVMVSLTAGADVADCWTELAQRLNVEFQTAASVCLQQDDCAMVLSEAISR